MMVSVSARNVGMPNLIELMETTEFQARCDFSIASDEVRKEPSLCADEFGQPPSILPLSILSAAGPCADEGSDSISDARLKADIEQVGTTVYGLPLFHFRYTDGVERFEGVMAQDVLNVMPNAVSVGADGFYRVNYGKLGIAMTRA